MIRVQCSNCQSLMTVTLGFEGQQVLCSYCGATFVAQAVPEGTDRTPWRTPSQPSGSAAQPIQGLQPPAYVPAPPPMPPPVPTLTARPSTAPPPPPPPVLGPPRAAPPPPMPAPPPPPILAPSPIQRPWEERRLEYLSSRQGQAAMHASHHAGAEARHWEALHGAQQARGGLGYLKSARGGEDLRRAAADEMAAKVTAAIAAAVEQKAKLAYLRGPEGREYLARQESLVGRATTRQGAGELEAQRARTAWMQGPEGQRHLRMQGQQRREGERLREAQERARRVAEHGPGSVAIDDARKSFGDLQGAMGGAMAVVSQMKAMGRLASPSHAATLDASFDLLQQQIGKYLLPSLDMMSAGAQRTARTLEMVPAPLRKYWANNLAGIFDNRIPGTNFSLPGINPGITAGYAITKQLMNGISWLMPEARKSRLQANYQRDRNSSFGKSWVGEGVFGFFDAVLPEAATGIAQKDQLLRRFAGLPPSQTMGFEDYTTQAQSAALNASPADTELLRQQLEALHEVIGKTDDVVKALDNRAPSPQFRGW